MKHVQKVIALLLTITFLMSLIPQITLASGNILIDFEKYKLDTLLGRVGFAITGTYVGSTTIAEDPINKNNKTMRMEKKSGTMVVNYKFPVPLSGKIQIKYKMYVTSPSYRQMPMVWGDGKLQGEKAVAFVANDSSGLVIIDGTYSQKGFELGKWQEYTIIIDTKENTSEYFLDNEIIRKSKHKESQQVKNITRIQFSMDSGDPIYVDDIRINRIVGDKDPMLSNVKITNGVINVLDCGAIPDDEIDDTAAIKTAISAAIRNTNKPKVFLPKGKYVIGSTKGTRNAFTYTDVDGLIIEGNEATFELTDNYSGFFKFDKSKNINISGITFDYVHPPWTQGEVTAIDVKNGSFTFETPDVNQNIFDDERFGTKDWLKTGDASTAGFGMVRQKNDPTMLKADPNFFVLLRGVEKKAPGKYELYLHKSHFGMVGVGPDKIEVGDKYVHSNRGVNGEVFDMRGSGNISISNCTIYASPGCTLIGANALGYIKMDNVHTKIKPNSGRFVSSNADGIHIQASRYPVEITNCTFEGLADDGMNLYQRTMQVTKAISDTEIEISGVDATGGMPMVGDVIDVINAPTGVMRGTAKVAQVTPIDSVRWNVILETPIENIQVGENRLLGDIVYNRNVQFPNSIIRNNTFKNIRGRGTLLRVIDAIVENNKYINLSGSGIVIRNFPDEYEGASGRNITIRGNEFTNTGSNRNDYGTDYSAAIQLVGITTGHGYTKDTIHENITIENNTFESYGRNAIYAGATKNLTIKNNTFISKEVDRVFGENMCVLNLNNVINGIITGNSITEPREAIKAAIKLNKNNENVTLSENVFNLHANSTQTIETEYAVKKEEVEKPKEKPRRNISWIVKKANTPIVVDANISGAEWGEITWMQLDKQEQVQSFTTPWTLEDLSGRIGLKWDEKNLYLAVEVTDNIHNQKNDEKAGDLWKADSVQFALDTDQLTGPGSKGFTEIGLGITNKNNLLKARFATQPILKELPFSISYAAKRDEVSKKTYYEVAMPWKQVFGTAKKVEEGTTIGFSALINDADEGKRKGWIEYYSGIGNGKIPALFGSIMFVNNDFKESFEDIKGHFAQSDIEQLINWGIIKGDGNANFNPDDAISRAEFLTLLCRALNIPNAIYDDEFADVAKSDWFAIPIKSVLEYKILDFSLVDNGMIHPNDVLTRTDAQNIVGRILKKAKSNQKAEDIVNFNTNIITKAEAAVIIRKIIY